MALRWPAYLAAFVGSLVLAWQLTPLLLRIGPGRCWSRSAGVAARCSWAPCWPYPPPAVWVGIPVPVAVCLLYAATVALGWPALLLAPPDLASGLLLGQFVLVVGTLLLVFLAAVPVHDNNRLRRSMPQAVRSTRQLSSSITQAPGRPPPEPRQPAAHR